MNMPSEIDTAMLDAIAASLDVKIPDQTPVAHGIILAVVAYEMAELLDRITVFGTAYNAAQKFIAGKQDAATA